MDHVVGGAEDRGRVVHVAHLEARLQAQLGGEAAGGGDRGGREVEAGDARAAARPVERGEAEVALEVDQVEALDGPHLLQLEVVEPGGAGPEAVHVVERAADVDRDPLVPERAVQGERVLGRHARVSSWCCRPAAVAAASAAVPSLAAAPLAGRGSARAAEDDDHVGRRLGVGRRVLRGRQRRGQAEVGGHEAGLGLGALAVQHPVGGGRLGGVALRHVGVAERARLVGGRGGQARTRRSRSGPRAPRRRARRHRGGRAAWRRPSRRPRRPPRR